MAEWAVLCPGPSLARARIIQADPDCMVAVNGGIVSPFDVKYWTLMDVECLESCYRAMGASRLHHVLDRTILWAPERFNDDLLGSDLHVSQDLREFYLNCLVEPWPMNPREALCERMPAWCKQIDWRLSTLTVAIALVILRDPQLSIICCYGVDWSGDSYHVPAIANVRTDLSERRFQLEQVIFEQARDALASQGKQLERVRC